ncbi:AlpA family transcriptional regulator [Acinetobacter bereziniae]|jgi:prophage regulatory protein|uniref:helix-turn-helix transcriptional regulator n=1 Tax=Acinetobacter TaxID=469 RepID=UPI0019075357|nr:MULTISPECIES: AlpA family transcriptional regulator [Acinetobacter]MBR7688329.1 AlpA family transcriptional regulator [Acinetobacter nosocomialis]MBR7702908.1 AlpA family transcriptional regulator [Acinetobacter nosocomialis]MBR7761984.1 AlpA family transcriptional regulator [Acinetobacter nosocomialis]MCH7387436.1 AlpA family transcriptional regulator [Acinetobacter modestus]MDG3557591.1 AlpA family transcriptional regulator [Acinetobacter bereziniae]
MNTFVGETFTMHQIINLKQVVFFTGISRATIYKLINAKMKCYDPTFPKPVHLTTGRVGWSALEVHQWIESKLNSR